MVASKFLFDDGTGNFFQNFAFFFSILNFLKLLKSIFVIDDECYNDDWACGVGMNLEKLNSLEIEFLSEFEKQLS